MTVFKILKNVILPLQPDLFKKLSREPEFEQVSVGLMCILMLRGIKCFFAHKTPFLKYTSFILFVYVQFRSGLATYNLLYYKKKDFKKVNETERNHFISRIDANSPTYQEIMDNLLVMPNGEYSLSDGYVAEVRTIVTFIKKERRQPSTSSSFGQGEKNITCKNVPKIINVCESRNEELTNVIGNMKIKEENLKAES